jgi:DNA recombination protein RmuC
MSGHLAKVGRSLDTAVAAYNQAVGSWESRVLVAARRFEELDVTDDRLAVVPALETAARPVGSVHPLPPVSRRAADEEEPRAHTVGP